MLDAGKTCTIEYNILRVLLWEEVYYPNFLTLPHSSELMYTAISFIMFWDFSKFSQIFFYKKWNKGRLLLINIVYTSCSSSCWTNLRLRISGNQETLGKCLNFINDSRVPSPPAKIKILLVLPKKSSKIAIKRFPWCTISSENYS